MSDFMSSLAVIVSCITAIIGILSPFITSLIRFRHEKWLRKLELKEEKEKEKIAVLLNFLSVSGSLIAAIGIRTNQNGSSIAELRSLEEFKAFDSCYFKIYAFLPLEYWEQFDLFYKSVHSFSNNLTKVKTDYVEVTHIISNLIKQEVE